MGDDHPFLLYYISVMTTTQSWTAGGRGIRQKKKKKNESKKAFLCKSQEGLLVSVVWQKKKKKKKGKKSPQRHGISYKSLFRDPFTITIPGDMHSLLLVVKGKISRFWKMHAHKQGSHRLRKTSRETLRHNASPSVQTDT